MAKSKKKKSLIKLVSPENSNVFYVRHKKSKGTSTEKLKLRKFDYVARKHLIFTEKSI